MGDLLTCSSPLSLSEAGDACIGPTKAEVYGGRYENFRKGLSVTPAFINASCHDELDGVTFAFVCVDKGSSRAGTFDLLISKGVPFIDVGMGLNRKRGPINGLLRTTYYSAEHEQEVKEKDLAPLSDDRQKQAQATPARPKFSILTTPSRMTGATSVNDPRGKQTVKVRQGRYIPRCNGATSRHGRRVA